MDITSFELALQNMLINYLTDIQRNEQVQLSGRTKTGNTVLCFVFMSLLICFHDINVQ